MSFSGEVKEELGKQLSHARNCQIAELAALLLYCGHFIYDSYENRVLQLRTENNDVVRKYFTLLKKAYNIETDILRQENNTDEKKSLVILEISDKTALKSILQGIKWADNSMTVKDNRDTVNELLIQNMDTKRAFIRGAYLAIGSMSDPQKAYHLEFVCISETQAEQLCRILNEFEVDAKIVLRKKYHVVYVKEGSGIVDLLNIMEAHVALMNLENLRIEKEIRNSINRRVNCETANITKTVNASTKQVEDIILLRDRYGLRKLPELLRQTAQVRLEYPDASLKELGTYMDPPVGKSGMNHRLHKLSEIADQIRYES